MQFKIYKGNGYRIHTIKTNKFKNCSIEIMFRNKLDKNKITENNVLVDVISSSSLKYPNRRDVAIELENLYASTFKGFVSRLGNTSLISFATDFLNPKYCEEGFLEEVLSFPFEMINNPNIHDGKFDDKMFNIVKNRLKSDIESIKENATRYAFRRSLMHMDDNSPSSYQMVGYLEQLEKITTSSLVKTYNNMINNSICDIYVIGDLDMEEVVSIIKRKFNLNKRNDQDIELYVENNSRDIFIDIQESGKYEQDSFIMIYNIEDLDDEEKNFAFQLYNIILGSGGLTSKLYQYLREQNSLCYTVSSLYQKYDRLLMIYAGINAKDKDKCIKLVNKAMKEMEDGIFSDEELNNAKLTAITSIRMGEDNQDGIITNYLFNDLDNFPLSEERIKRFNNVSKEDIIRVAKKVKLNTIYLLTGEDK